MEFDSVMRRLNLYSKAITLEKHSTFYALLIEVNKEPQSISMIEL